MGRVKPKRRRQFTHHARRWQHGMKAEKPGQLIQLDHMTVHFTEGVSLKEFKATCPITGFTVMRAYRSASSLNARQFLHALIEQLPYPLLSVQVDGGSEVHGRIRTQACKDLTLPLYACLLQAGAAPKKPQVQWLCRARQPACSRQVEPAAMSSTPSMRAHSPWPPSTENWPSTSTVTTTIAPMMVLDWRPLPAAGRPMAYYQKLGQAA